MNTKRAGKRSRKTPSGHWIRASISFPPDVYERLEEIAKGKTVSLAWVVRDAAESYVVSAGRQAGEDRHERF
jgi:hypothetical protein